MPFRVSFVVRPGYLRGLLVQDRGEAVLGAAQPGGDTTRRCAAALAGLDEIYEQAAQARRWAKVAVGGQKAPAALPGALGDKVLAHLDAHPGGELRHPGRRGDLRARRYEDVPELELRDASGNPVAEADLIAVGDDEVIVAKAKSNDALGRNTREVRRAAAKRVVNSASAPWRSPARPPPRPPARPSSTAAASADS